MPELTPAAARVLDPVLSNVAMGYVHPEHVGHELFPRVPVGQRGGQVLTFGRESFRLYNAVRAPGAATKRIEIGFGAERFALSQESLEGFVPVEIQQDASRVPGVDLGSRAVNTVMAALSLGLEYEQAQLARDAARYDTDHKTDLAAAKWTDDTNNPADDIDDGREAIRSSVGIYPNTCVLSAAAFNAARRNAKVVERFKYTGRDSITAEMLARLWDIDKVIIGRAIAFTGAEDSPTSVDIWGKDVILAHVPRGALSREMPSFGYTYTLQGNPATERPYYDNNRKSWLYPVVYERHPVITGMAAGFLLQNVA